MTRAELEQAKMIPESHPGVFYGQFLTKLSEVRSTQRYLEVGVCGGDIFSEISAEVAVGVDPAFTLRCNVANKKKKVILHQMTSDAFFADIEAVSTLGGSPDLVFLDGLHQFEYLLRDFYNAERISSPNTLILMHDCLPLTVQMAHRDQVKALTLGAETKHPDAWTGDVWKLIPILKEYRPDLRLVFVDCPWTGLVCITNLDPSSRVLDKNYLNIVDKYLDLENNEREISNMYKSISLSPSSDVMNRFDQSLYFKV